MVGLELVKVWIGVDSGLRVITGMVKDWTWVGYGLV